MRILHYFLGFPPWRSGGMTKFCTDLMQGQHAAGDTVSALWPGRMALKTGILRRGEAAGILRFELAGPLPVPLGEGVYRPEAFITPCDKTVYEGFLARIRPDVIHVHTLMGLHREFLDAAAEKGIPVLFTLHDYYGICPKVTLFRDGGACTEDHGCADCAACCAGALTPAKIWLLQSPLYRKWKDAALVRTMRSRHREQFFEEAGGEKQGKKTAADSVRTSSSASDGFRQLRAYYVSMLESFTAVHFASRIARRTAEKYFRPRAGAVFPISHRDLLFGRTIPRKGNERKEGPLSLVYSGGLKPYKGYRVIFEAFDALYKEGRRDFVLNYYGSCGEDRPYLRKHGAYTYDGLGRVMENADAVLVPSVWYETFGFAVPEAVSFGVPVIVSDRVGAGEYLGGAGLVTAGSGASALKEALASLTKEKLLDMRLAAGTADFPDWATFVSGVRDFYGEYRR